MSIEKTTICLILFGLWNLHAAQAQPGLTDEVDRMVSSLVEQINRLGSVKTVAVADFTDIHYHPNHLGRQLAEEFMTSLVISRDRKFTIINRSQLKALMKEARLDADGLLAPNNIPMLGRLKGVGLIIGATLSPTYNEVRVNVQGIELETGSSLAAERGNITLTPSLQQLLEEPVGDDGSDAKPTPGTSSSSFNVKEGNLEVEIIGCQLSGGQMECRFKASSLQGENVLSVFANQSQVILSAGETKGSIPFKVELGDSSGKGRVTKILKAGKETPLIVFASPDPMPTRGPVEVILSCYSNKDGVFKLHLKDIPLIK